MHVAVLGCGNMGRAVVVCLSKRYGGEIAVDVYDKRPEALRDLPSQATVKAPEQWFNGSDQPESILLAVKPQDMALTLTPFRGVKATPLWVSIAAGVTLDELSDHLGKEARICRVMPNTPALIGQGMSAYSLNTNCTADDTALAERILGACGSHVAVPEGLMNAVTGLSGSGPAYVYLFLEALIEGGVTSGLPYSVARECAVQTVIGAARLVHETGEAPAVLKGRVMSPGGTTARGLLELERQGFKYAVINAVNAAAARAAELGKRNCGEKK